MRNRLNQIFFIFFTFFACNLVWVMLQGARIKGVEAEKAGSLWDIEHNASLGFSRLAGRAARIAAAAENIKLQGSA